MKKQRKLEYEQPKIGSYTVVLEYGTLVGSQPFQTEDLEEEEVEWGNN